MNLVIFQIGLMIVVRFKADICITEVILVYKALLANTTGLVFIKSTGDYDWTKQISYETKINNAKRFLGEDCFLQQQDLASKVYLLI